MTAEEGTACIDIKEERQEDSEGAAIELSRLDKKVYVGPAGLLHSKQFQKS
jgi:hypothetical protein